MKRITVVTLLLLFLAVTFISASSKISERCIQLATLQRTTDFKLTRISSCDMKGRKLTVLSKKKYGNIKYMYSYKSTRDFIAMRKRTGLLLFTSMTVSFKGYKSTTYLVKDKKGKPLNMKNDKDGIVMKYLSWDRYLRPLQAYLYNIGKCRKIKLIYAYDDRQRMMKLRYIKGEDQKCWSYVHSRTYYNDSHGNLIRMVINMNGKKRTQFKTFKYKKICY